MARPEEINAIGEKKGISNDHFLPGHAGNRPALGKCLLLEAFERLRIYVKIFKRKKFRDCGFIGDEPTPAVFGMGTVGGKQFEKKTFVTGSKSRQQLPEQVEGVSPGRVQKFQKHIHLAAADHSQGTGDIGTAEIEAFNHGAARHVQLPGTLDDLGFNAAAADGADDTAIFPDNHFCTGAPGCRARVPNDRCQHHRLADFQEFVCLLQKVCHFAYLTAYPPIFNSLNFTVNMNLSKEC